MLTLGDFVRIEMMEYVSATPPAVAARFCAPSLHSFEMAAIEAQATSSEERDFRVF